MLLVSRVSFLLSSHFLASVLVSCLRCVHRWSARSSSRVAFSAYAACVVFTLGSCSVLLVYSICSGNLFLWEGNLQSITVSSAYCLVRLACCPLHSAYRGQPPLRRHRSVSTLVEASGLCCRGCRLITNRSVCLRRGGHQSEARRFRSVGCHSCPG